MMRAIGRAVRDGDGIAILLELGPRSGCYRVMAVETPALLAGAAPATIRAGGMPVGVIAPSRDLRVLRGAFRTRRGFVRAGELVSLEETTFLIPRAHLAAHYARHDGPVPVLGAGGRWSASAIRSVFLDAAGEGES